MKFDEVTFYTFNAAHRYFTDGTAQMMYTNSKLFLTLQLERPANLPEQVYAIVLYGIEYECEPFTLNSAFICATLKRISSDVYTKMYKQHI